MHADLVALDLPAIVKAAGYPGTTVIPVVSSILSLLALKLASIRRTSHVEDLATDHAAALLAGLTSPPKNDRADELLLQALTRAPARVPSAINSAMLGAGLIDGSDFDLDFHATMHRARTPRSRNTTSRTARNRPGRRC